MEPETLQSPVGQVGNLQRVGNPPGELRPAGPIADRPQDAILPTKGEAETHAPQSRLKPV
jgi:hypothetical protein